MNTGKACGILFFVCALMLASRSAVADDALRAGDAFQFGGKSAVVKTMDALPYVDSEYTRAFKFDSVDNPKLKELREKYKLDEVVAPGKDEFERQVILMDWVNSRFPKFGTPSSDARGALKVLQAVEEGHTFFCAHYTDVLVSSAASLGWIDRPLALRRPKNLGDWANEHSSNEIWSNQHKKWVLLDPTYNIHVEKKGIPLSAFEARQAWYYDDGAEMEIFIGKDRKKYTKADLPIFRRTFEKFGDIKVNPTTFYFYGFIGYIPGNALMDKRDLGIAWIFKDKFGDGTPWHTRPAPKDPEHDLYFPMGQAALSLVPAGEEIRVALKTLTPNFETFLTRVDGGEWKPAGETFVWKPHAGANRLEAKTLNKFGVEGPVSVVEVELVGAK